MGSSARMSRSERFIEEFNETACEIADMLHFPCVGSQALGFGNGEQVHLYIRMDWQGRSEEMMDETVYFDPEEGDEDLIERVVDLFKIEEEEAVARLKKAELID